MLREKNYACNAKKSAGATQIITVRNTRAARRHDMDGILCLKQATQHRRSTAPPPAPRMTASTPCILLYLMNSAPL